MIADLLTGVPWSWNPLDDLQQLFLLQSAQSAYIAGTAAAIAAGVVGYFVVLRGLSFAAHTISQAGFAGVTGAMVLNAPPLAGLLLVNGAAALIIGTAGIRERSRDVVVGIVLCCTLALGLLFLSLSRAGEVVTVLVGDVNGIAPESVPVTVAAAALATAFIGLLYRPLLFATLDAEVAEAGGVASRRISVAMLLALAVTASALTPIIGVLLTFALLVGPAATAAILSARPARAIGLAVVIGVAYLWIGLAAATWIAIPASFFVTTLSFCGYLLARLLRRRRDHVPAERGIMRRTVAHS